MTRRVSDDADCAGFGGGVDELVEEARLGCEDRAYTLGMRDGEVRRELRDGPAVVLAAVAGLLTRVAPLVQSEREDAQSLERI